MIFYKTSSFGNDFIEIDQDELPTPEVDRAVMAREICDVHHAVGADGVIFYRARRHGFGFQVHNRDGSEAELSGNGMAGLAAVLFQRRLASAALTLYSAVGRRHVDLLARRGPLFQLNVEIGQPDFLNRGFFPFLKDRRDCYRVDGLEFYPVAVGNPHAVILCRAQSGPKTLAALGKKLEGHGMFPRRVNVEFVYFSDAAHCRVFFYERGVGPTLASSTGSAAVFAVLRRLGKIGDHLNIDCGDEKIVVSWKRGVFVNNFTRLICRGEYFI